MLKGRDQERRKESFDKFYKGIEKIRENVKDVDPKEIDDAIEEAVLEVKKIENNKSLSV